MKKFLSHIVIFLLVLFVLGYGLDFVITKGLHKYMGYETEVWNNLRSGKDSTNVVILGGCSAMHDINPIKLDSALGCNSYAYAMSNLTFPCHLFMWNEYQKYGNPKPKLIILCLDYGDMNFRDIKGDMENEQFLPLTDSKIARKFLLKYGGYKWSEIYLPCIRYFGHQQLIKNGLKQSLHYSRNLGRHRRIKGFIPLDIPYHSWNIGEEKVRVSMEPEIQQMYESFMQSTKRDSIPVLAIVTPLCYDLESHIVNRDEIYNYYDSIAKEEHFFVNCTGDEFAKDTANFESPNHLNAQAADVFTHRVIDIIRDFDLY